MIDRREMLRRMGVASAASILWACSGRGGNGRNTTPVDRATEIRGRLREAVAKLTTMYPVVHALATKRHRISAAVDIVGAGVSRGRSDGIVIVVRDRDGRWREEVGSDLSSAGIAAVVKALGAAGAKPAIVNFGKEGVATKLAGVDPDVLADGQLRRRAEELASNALGSRIVYAAGLVEIDDATVWSIAVGRDLEQRLVRVRRTTTRVAWNGTRPVVGETSVGWRGGFDDRPVAEAELQRASIRALELMTPVAFPDGDYDVLLEPEVAAAAIDTIARTLLVAPALRRPEVAARLAPGSQVAATALTLTDDPTDRTAYGGFEFDDEGEPARPLVLLDGGRVANRLGDRMSAPGIPGGRGLRAGHIGPAGAAPSHMSIAAGTKPRTKLLGDGFILEGPRSVIVDPSSGRINLVVDRAREMAAGAHTGRVFADVEIAGDLGMLAAMTQVSSDRSIVTYRDETASLPRWRSIETPWIISRGTVRGWRRR